MKNAHFGLSVAAAVLAATLVVCPGARAQAGRQALQPPPGQAARANPLPERARVRSATITILSANVTNGGIGEWGFAALVEADGRLVLFDTGAQPDTVLRNLRFAKIDLSNVTDLVLSHRHGDHTGGFKTLRAELAKTNPRALSRTHVAQGFFYPRVIQGREWDPLARMRADYEAGGGTFFEHAKAEEIFPGVWVTGPVARIHPEKNYGGGQVRRPDSTLAEDNVPEDQALVLDTDRGLVVLSGCGHAGIINTLAHARAQVRKAPIHAVIGGFHLIGMDDEHMEWTGRQLKELGVEQFLGAHCTGLEAVYRIRQATGLDRKLCAVGAVGSVFRLGKGIDPGPIAR